MRTTIDLPDDLHRQARSLAQDRRMSLSDVVAELMRKGLGQEAAHVSYRRDPLTGLTVTDLGQVVTTQDVRQLEDD